MLLIHLALHPPHLSGPRTRVLHLQSAKYQSFLDAPRERKLKNFFNHLLYSGTPLPRPSSPLPPLKQFPTGEHLLQMGEIFVICLCKEDNGREVMVGRSLTFLLLGSGLLGCLAGLLALANCCLLVELGYKRKKVNSEMTNKSSNITIPQDQDHKITTSHYSTSLQWKRVLSLQLLKFGFSAITGNDSTLLALLLQ